MRWTYCFWLTNVITVLSFLLLVGMAQVEVLPSSSGNSVESVQVVVSVFVPAPVLTTPKHPMRLQRLVSVVEPELVQVRNWQLGYRAVALRSC